jgi:transcriptional regulator with XRE-family HTH domain
MTNDELRNNIKVNLINLRKKKDVTQVKIAELMNKSSNAVASWEQGLSLPDVTTLYKLSKYYNVSMEYFYLNHEEEGEI